MLEQLKSYNILGCIGVVIIVIAALWTLTYFLQTFYLTTKAAENMNVTPSPVVMQAPYSNAPVKGEPKREVVPEVWDGTASGYNNTANFTLADKMVVRWDLIPASARVITFGFRLSNPPITGKDSHNQKEVMLMNSIPNTNGIAVAFLNRGKYKINAGRTYGTLDFIRQTSDFNMNEERVEIRFTQIAPLKTRIEAIYNGEDFVIAPEKAGNISDLRMWPQQLHILEPNKLQNVWLSYSS